MANTSEAPEPPGEGRPADRAVGPRPRRPAAGDGYSTREVSEVLGIPASTILSWTRAGLLSPSRGPGGAYRYAFQDVALLRSARELLNADVPSYRVKKALETLQRQLPAGRPLSALNLAALGGTVVVRENRGTWEPTSGQLHLDLPDRGPPVRRFATRSAPILQMEARLAESARRAAGATADDWYDMGLDMESKAVELAKGAYLRALALNPRHADAHLNLGRILHEEGAVSSAEAHYRDALEADPASARAFYNLGVALEDQGRRSGAVEAYEAALRLDPDLAVAHFNMSRLFEALGYPTEALRHLAAYKRILDESGVGA